jgi:L-2-hydroxyglutarate oxidase
LRDSFESLTWPGMIKVMSKNMMMGIGEYYRSFYKPAFVKALQRLVPEIKSEDLEPGGAGVRAQACSKDGGLLDIFICEDKRRFMLQCHRRGNKFSFSIGDYISQKYYKFIDDLLRGFFN